MLPGPCSARVKTMPSPTLIPGGRTPSHFCGTVLPTARQTWYSLCKSNTHILKRKKNIVKNIIANNLYVVCLSSRKSYYQELFLLNCIRYKHDVIVTYQIYILCVMKNHNEIHRYWWLLIFKSYCNTVKLITYIFRFAVWLMKCITQTRNMNIAICFSLINFSKFSSFI